MQVDEDVGKVAAAVPVIICIFSSVFSVLVSIQLVTVSQVLSCNKVVSPVIQTPSMSLWLSCNKVVKLLQNIGEHAIL